MGRLSDADAHDMLDSRFGAGAAAPTNAPADYWVALSSTKPNDDGTGITEPAGNGYARLQVPNDAVNFPAAAARAKANGVVWQFAEATAGWGVVGWFALMDDPAAGAMRAWGHLPQSVDVPTGNAPLFPVGACTINAPGG